MRVSVQGYYGMGNFGDDLFCLAIIKALETHPGIHIRVAAPSNGASSRFVLPGTRRVVGTWRSVGIMGRAFRTAVKTWETARADAVVVAGGSVFKEVRGARRIAEALGLYSRRSLYAIGVSLGPFRTDASRQRVQQLANRFSGLWVRDSASIERARGLRVEAAFSGDIATSIAYKSRSRGTWLGYAPCAQAPIDATDVAAGLKDLMVRHHLKGIRVFALNANANTGDRVAAIQVIEELRRAGVPVEFVDYATVDINDVIESIAELRFLVSVRLHGAIVAYSCGVPFILGEYEEKCSEFLDDVECDPQLRVNGVRDIPTLLRRVNINTVSAPGVPPQRYRSAAEDALSELSSVLSPTK